MTSNLVCIKSGIDKKDPIITEKLNQYVKYLEENDLPRYYLMKELKNPEGRVYNPTVIEHIDTEIYVTDYAFIYNNDDIIGHLCYRIDLPWGFKLNRISFFEQEKYCKLPIAVYPNILDYLDSRVEGKFSYEGILSVDEKIYKK